MPSRAPVPLSVHPAPLTRLDVSGQALAPVRAFLPARGLRDHRCLSPPPPPAAVSPPPTVSAACQSPPRQPSPQPSASPAGVSLHRPPPHPPPDGPPASGHLVRPWLRGWPAGPRLCATAAGVPHVRRCAPVLRTEADSRLQGVFPACSVALPAGGPSGAGPSGRCPPPHSGCCNRRVARPNPSRSSSPRLPRALEGLRGTRPFPLVSAPTRRGSPLRPAAVRTLFLAVRAWMAPTLRPPFLPRPRGRGRSLVRWPGPSAPSVARGIWPVHPSGLCAAYVAAPRPAYLVALAGPPLACSRIRSFLAGPAVPLLSLPRPSDVLWGLRHPYRPGLVWAWTPALAAFRAGAVPLPPGPRPLVLPPCLTEIQLSMLSSRRTLAGIARLTQAPAMFASGSVSERATATGSLNTLDARTAAVCERIKGRDIELYTVLFAPHGGYTGASHVEQLLRECATTPHRHVFRVLRSRSWSMPSAFGPNQINALRIRAEERNACLAGRGGPCARRAPAALCGAAALRGRESGAHSQLI